MLVERSNDSSLTHRSHISFFRDGCDGAEKQAHWHDIGVLFYREDFSETLAEQRKRGKPLYSRVHIPTQEAQDQLIDAWDYQANLQRGDRTKLDVIARYLTSILNVQSAWIERSAIG